jgi:hypothetical protein
VSMRGVCVVTAGEVLCVKVPLRETGDMASEVRTGGCALVERAGGEMGVEVVMFAAV